MDTGTPLRSMARNSSAGNKRDSAVGSACGPDRTPISAPPPLVHDGSYAGFVARTGSDAAGVDRNQ